MCIGHSFHREFEDMLTVGLPIYNAELWLKECLDSIMTQSFHDWELIVTDDGSSDKTIEIIQAFCQKYQMSNDRICVVADGEHLGISARINQQVEMARGEYFARMDADDVMLPERLAVQVKYMEEHPEVDVCGTQAGPWTFIHPTVMGKTSWFREHPYRSECDGCEDWDLWLRTRKNSIFGFIDTPILYYRQPEKIDKKKYLLRRRQGRVAIRMNRDILPGWKYYWLLADSYAKSVFAKLFY